MTMNQIIEKEYMLHKKLIDKEILCIPKVYLPNLKKWGENSIFLMDYIDYSI